MAAAGWLMTGLEGNAEEFISNKIDATTASWDLLDGYPESAKACLLTRFSSNRHRRGALNVPPRKLPRLNIFRVSQIA